MATVRNIEVILDKLNVLGFVLLKNMHTDVIKLYSYSFIKLTSNTIDIMHLKDRRWESVFQN
jgi:hypothetical protein